MKRRSTEDHPDLDSWHGTCLGQVTDFGRKKFFARHGNSPCQIFCKKLRGMPATAAHHEMFSWNVDASIIIHPYFRDTLYSLLQKQKKRTGFFTAVNRTTLTLLTDKNSKNALSTAPPRYRSIQFLIDHLRAPGRPPGRCSKVLWKIWSYDGMTMGWFFHDLVGDDEIPWKYDHLYITKYDFVSWGWWFFLPSSLLGGWNNIVLTKSWNKQINPSS